MISFSFMLISHIRKLLLCKNLLYFASTPWHPLKHSPKKYKNIVHQKHSKALSQVIKMQLLSHKFYFLTSHVHPEKLVPEAPVGLPSVNASVWTPKSL